MMFFSAALAHLLAVMSPGPDTAIIFHQSVMHGRAQGILTALGIGFGIFIHCFFAISGISLLIYSSEESKFFIKCLGAIYLLYLGISFFISKKSSKPDQSKVLFKNPFIIGLVTNLLNVKAFLFTISLFSFINLAPSFRSKHGPLSKCMRLRIGGRPYRDGSRRLLYRLLCAWHRARTEIHRVQARCGRSILHQGR